MPMNEPVRILVVDDEEFIRDVLQRRLSQDGRVVETASDGVEAIEKFTKGPFDAVVTDLAMPRMGGVELVKRIKESSPQTVTIVLTGHATLDSAMEVLRQGCDDYLLKPISNLDLVVHALERCLSRRNALAMAAATKKVSEAKDGILLLVVEECAGRVEGIRKCAAQIDASCAAAKPEEARAHLATLKALLAQLDGVLADVRTASRTIKN